MLLLQCFSIFFYSFIFVLICILISYAHPLYEYVLFYIESLILDADGLGLSDWVCQSLLYVHPETSSCEVSSRSYMQTQRVCASKCILYSPLFRRGNNTQTRKNIENFRKYSFSSKLYNKLSGYVYVCLKIQYRR